MNNLKTFIYSTLLTILTAFLLSYMLGELYPLITISSIFLIGLAGYFSIESDENTNSILNKLIIKGFIVTILLTSITDVVKFNNKSVSLKQQYVENVNNKKSFVNNLYTVYTEKHKITNLNKETFIEITNIIMSGRKDGQSLSWKWLQENQPIPYSEFSNFYKDLSYFIEKYKTDTYLFDKTSNDIIKQNNILLNSFPNNIYNFLLNKENFK